MLVAGGSAVLFFSLSTITNGVLQGIGKQTVPLKNAAISLIANVAVLVCLTKFTPLGAYSVMIANLAYGICMCILNQLALRKYLKYKNEYVNTYLKPLAAAAGMGVTAWIVYYGLYVLIHRNLICLIVAIPAAVIVYMLLYVIITKIPEEEMRRFPMGTKLVRILRMIHIY